MEIWRDGLNKWLDGMDSIGLFLSEPNRAVLTSFFYPTNWTSLGVGLGISLKQYLGVNWPLKGKI